MSARRRGRAWIGLVVLLAAGGAGVFGFLRVRGAKAAGTLATAPARQGEFLVMVRCRGELKARRSKQISAPMVPQLRIVWLAPAGEPVKEGDVVIRFDPSSAQQQLQEKQAALKQAQASLEQAVAEARITEEQDKRDLAQAEYDVEKARLEASKAEIVSKLQGEENRIELAVAEQKLKVQQATVALHRASGKAKVGSLTSARDQAQDDVDLTKSRLAQMEVRAPLNGIIIYLSNYSQGWINAKPFKVGDQAWPGGVIAEIPDLTTLEMEGKIEEIDRGRIAGGNDARARIDSLPELSLPGKIGAISPLTEQSFEWPPTSSFRAFAPIQKPDPRLRPGMNGTLDVVVNRIPNAITIPAKALFTRKGKPTVYLAEKGRYRAAQVEVLARNPDEIAIHGVSGGAMVALTQPPEEQP